MHHTGILVINQYHPHAESPCLTSPVTWNVTMGFEMAPDLIPGLLIGRDAERS